MANEPDLATGSGGSSPAPAGGGAADLAGSTGGGSGAVAGSPPPSPTPAATPPGGSGTLAGGTVPETTAPASPQTWPDDWRQKLAGDDKAYLKTLERFTDPAGLAKAYRDAQTRMSSGALKTAAPSDTATPEEIATWRQENGIPLDPKGYLEKLDLPNGMVPGEADQPVLEAFAQRMHGKNVSPDAMKEAVSWYYETQDAQRKDLLAQDSTFRQQSLDTLNREWGGEFRSNINGVNNFLKGTADEATLNEILGARGPSGRPLGDNPGFLKWVAGLQREQNPMASLLPAGTTDPMKGGEARIKEIEGKMRGADGGKEYWTDPKMQEELRNLYAAQERMQGRG